MAEEEGIEVYPVKRCEEDIHVVLIIVHQCQSLVVDIMAQLMMKHRGLDLDTGQKVVGVSVHLVLGLVLDQVPDHLTAGKSISHRRKIIVVILNPKGLIRKSHYMPREHQNIGRRMRLIIIRRHMLIIR